MEVLSLAASLGHPDTACAKFSLPENAAFKSKNTLAR